jgi:hypothetical protein
VSEQRGAGGIEGATATAKRPEHRGVSIPNPPMPDDPEHGYMARVAREILPRVRSALGVRTGTGLD